VFIVGYVYGVVVYCADDGDQVEKTQYWTGFSNAYSPITASPSLISALSKPHNVIIPISCGQCGLVSPKCTMLPVQKGKRFPGACWTMPPSGQKRSTSKLFLTGFRISTSVLKVRRKKSSGGSLVSALDGWMGRTKEYLGEPPTLVAPR